MPYILPGLISVDSYITTDLGAANMLYRHGMGAMADSVQPKRQIQPHGLQAGGLSYEFIGVLERVGTDS